MQQQIIIKNTGKFSNGASWSWQFGCGVHVYGRNGDLLRVVEIQDFTFKPVNVAHYLTDDLTAIDAELSSLETELDSVCEECASHEDEALSAFEWHGLLCVKQTVRDTLKAHNLGSVKAFKASTDKRKSVIRVIVEELRKRACENVRSMMAKYPDSVFRKFTESQTVKDRALRIVTTEIQA